VIETDVKGFKIGIESRLHKHEHSGKVDEELKKRDPQLKSKEIELKTERLRLREEWLKFKRDRFESWKKLMEEKGRQKENRFKVRVQLQRDKLEFRKKQLFLKERIRTKPGYRPR
jgi:hypothetical protein